jgi:predicted O-methyltransferase YrrM
MTAADYRSFHLMGDACECTDELAQFLSVIARGYCVDAGTYRGKSARALAVGAQRVDTLDPCPDCWAARPAMPPNVHAHQCLATDFIPSAKLDVLFIDSGLHSRLDDYRHLSQWMAPHGLVIIDDVNVLTPELFAGRHAVLPYGSGVLVRRPG